MDRFLALGTTRVNGWFGPAERQKRALPARPSSVGRCPHGLVYAAAGLAAAGIAVLAVGLILLDTPGVAQPALRPAATSQHARLREVRKNTADASTSFSLLLASDSLTAIYDIAARTVYLPDGRRLEAHSGWGVYLDDPRYIKVKGLGPTPPNVYNLALRDRLFHGDLAIRLIPADHGKMFGRDGILTHSYLRGPSGQSNGCVVFRNYPAFLNAFLRGEVNRLVVVDHFPATTGANTRSYATY
jgi:hypothetical protein